MADSQAHAIYVYEHDVTGAIGGRRLFADTASLAGIPDGATIDAEGRLWTAMCDGKRVICLDQAGAVVASIDMPTAFVSSVMFGGADLDRLYVTSIDMNAMTGVAAAANALHPPDEIGGALFVIDGLGVKGLPEHRFGGLSD